MKYAIKQTSKTGDYIMSNDHKEINTGNGPRKFFSSGTSAISVPFGSIPIIDFSAMFGEDETAKMNVGAGVS